VSETFSWSACVYFFASHLKQPALKMSILLPVG
jgi:hypothetical protein